MPSTTTTAHPDFPRLRTVPAHEVTALMTAPAKSLPNGLVNHSLVIKMADASPFRDEAFPGSVITGVQVQGYVPTYAKLDRRNRKTMREVHDAVRMVLCNYVRHDVDDLDAFSALANFSRRNRLRG